MSKQTVESGTFYMRMVLEKDIIKHPEYWHLVKSTAKSADGDSRAVCTRIYQLYINDKPTDVGIKFFYDYRVGKAKADFDIVALKVMEHQVKGDLDLEIIDNILTKKAEAK
jgi:hypothetical protein